MDIFFNLLVSQLNSSVIVLIALLGICFFMVFKIGRLSETFLNHKERINNVESIRDSVISLNTKVDLIYQNTNPNPLIKAQSPISLTEVGKQIVEEISAEEIFKKYAKKLIALVEGKAPSNAYDIQQCSFMVSKKELVDLLNDEELSQIKRVAFNRGLLVEDIMSTFGVLLRNKVLADKGIPVSDVDKYEKKPKE